MTENKENKQEGKKPIVPPSIAKPKFGGNFGGGIVQSKFKTPKIPMIRKPKSGKS